MSGKGPLHSCLLSIKRLHYPLHTGICGVSDLSSRGSAYSAAAMLPFSTWTAPFSCKGLLAAEAGAASAPWPLIGSVAPFEEGAMAFVAAAAAAAAGACACPLAGCSVLLGTGTFFFHGFLASGGGAAGLNWTAPFATGTPHDSHASALDGWLAT